MGIRDHPTAPKSPWQNGHAERLNGSIRRKYFDHVMVLGEDHLRRILAAYTAYYNVTGTHLALGKDTPLHRPVRRFGEITAQPILGGLHHKYCRTQFTVRTAGTTFSDLLMKCLFLKWAPADDSAFEDEQALI